VDLLQSALVTGLSLGLVYILYALGFSYTFSILGELNFAYGDSLVLTTFVALAAASAHVYSLVIVVIAIIVGAMTGLAVDLIAMTPLRNSGKSEALIVSGLGLALILRNITTSIWGPAARHFPDLFVNGATLPVGSQRLPVTTLIMLVFIALAVAFTLWLLKRTRLGLYIRAISQDPLAARLVGIPVNRANSFMYAWGGAMGGLAGILYASVYGVLGTSLGFQATIVAWIAVVLGGKRRLWGPVVGGAILGIAQSFLAVYVSTLYETTFTYVMMIGVLLVLPRGILEFRQTVRV
jgi:branched-chain amino acid transport system permease protein